MIRMCKILECMEVELELKWNETVGGVRRWR